MMKKANLPKQLELFPLFKPIQLVSSLSKPFTFVDLFSGIGGFRIPLEELGGKYLGYSEIDRDSIKVYQKNFINSFQTDEIYLGDITQISQLPFDKIDILVGGVPCQPWSIAGKLHGFNDSRGQLWFDVIRLVQKNKPRSFIFENVKGLTEPRNQDSLNKIIYNLSEAGYTVKWQVLNSYDFGLPQDRDRVFIIGIRNDLEKCQDFAFPQPLDIKPKLYDVIEGIARTKLQKKKFSPDILFGEKIPVSRGRFKKIDELNDYFIFADIRDGHTTIHSWDIIETTLREKLICLTILKNRRKKIYGLKDDNPLSFAILKTLISDLQEEELNVLVAKKILKIVEDIGYDFVNSKISSEINGICKIFMPQSDVIGTLTATGTIDFVATISLKCQEPKKYKQTFIREVYKKGKFKPIAARDYGRLQGFPDWFQIAEKEAVAKHQFGNAVSVPVVYNVAKSLLQLVG